MRLIKSNFILKLSFLLICSSLLTQCKSQQKIDWSQTSGWKLYDVRMNQFMKTSVADLEKLNNIPIDSLKPMLETASQWPKGSTAVWQSSYCTSCIFKNKIHKVIFSTYGGFFLDVRSERYYAVPEGLKKALKALLQQYQLKLIPDSTN